MEELWMFLGGTLFFAGILLGILLAGPVSYFAWLHGNITLTEWSDAWMNQGAKLILTGVFVSLVALHFDKLRRAWTWKKVQKAVSIGLAVIGTLAFLAIPVLRIAWYFWPPDDLVVAVHGLIFQALKIIGFVCWGLVLLIQSRNLFWALCGVGLRKVGPINVDPRDSISGLP